MPRQKPPTEEDFNAEMDELLAVFEEGGISRPQLDALMLSCYEKYVSMGVLP